MKSSIFLAASGALLALASPAAKRAVVYETVLVWETAYVTVEEPTSTEVFKFAGAHKVPTTTTTSTTSTSTTTSTTETPTSTSTPEPAPAPPTSEAPAPPAPSPDPVPVPSPSPEPAPAPAPVSVEAAPSPSPSPAPASGSPPSDSDVSGSGVYYHNAYRFNHSAPAVAWDSELAGYAQNTGSTCKFAHDMGQGKADYGQNLYMIASSDMTWTGAQALAHAAGAWYDEAPAYSNFFGEANPNGDFGTFGHFTQLVWIGSTSIGCQPQLCPKGTMYDDMDAYFVVCNYRPAGNFANQYANNVKPSLGQPPIALP